MTQKSLKTIYVKTDIDFSYIYKMKHILISQDRNDIDIIDYKNISNFIKEV